MRRAVQAVLRNAMGKQEHKLKRAGQLQRENELNAGDITEKTGDLDGAKMMVMVHTANRERYHRFSSRSD